MTFLHFNIYAWAPPPHHYMLGSISTFKHDDLSALKHLFVGPLILRAVSTFKCDNLSALKHLCVGPLHHTTKSLVQFQHSSVIVFLTLKHLCLGSQNIRKNRIKHSSESPKTFKCSLALTTQVIL